MSTRFEARPSPIHGFGVFAKRPIPPGTFIGQYLARRTDQDSTYTLWVDFGGEKRGYEGYGRLRFLNHASAPNAEFDERDLFALREILPGEEITISYGAEWADL